MWLPGNGCRDPPPPPPPCIGLSSFHVLPLLAPAIAELASNQIATHELTVGGNFTLSVNVTSFNIPLISISWARGGKPLTGDEDRVNIQTSAVLPVSSGSVTSTLQIGVAVLADAGNYIATVKSSTGSSTVQFEVIILTGIGACGVVSRKRVGGGGRGRAKTSALTSGSPV